MDKVGVIIPTYNRRNTIVKSVQSVLNQTYHNIEVIIVDDGSSDGTEDEIKSIKDSRINYVTLKSNRGVAYARNLGVDLAESEWIAFQDSDDIWRDNKLEKQMAYAQKHPEYSMVYCSYMAHFSNMEDVKIPKTPYLYEMEGKILNTLLLKNTIGAPTACVKKSTFLDVGGYNVTYRSLEDWEYAIRFAKKYEIGFVPDVLVDVYVSADGVSSQIGSYYESRCKMLKEYEKELEEAGYYEKVKKDILSRAESSGVIVLVKQIMDLLGLM